MIDLLWNTIKVASANAGILFLSVFFAWLVVSDGGECNGDEWYTKMFLFLLVACSVTLVLCGCVAATLNILTN